MTFFLSTQTISSEWPRSPHKPDHLFQAGLEETWQ